MSLPVYQYIKIKTASLDELESVLNPNMNLKHPVVLDLKQLSQDQQRETINLIENFFVSHNLSYKFPYPVYALSDRDSNVGRLPVFQRQEDLPRFFSQRESKMNVKESHVIAKNKLLQQEVMNTDTSSNLKDLETYGESHRLIYEKERERRFYLSLLEKIQKGKRNG